MRAYFVAIVAVVLVAAVVLVSAPRPARADGDPASDILLGTDVFYPFQPPVSTHVQNALEARTAAARKAGFPIKIALIASPVDLGVIPSLFGHPQAYAEFLDREISFTAPQPLLVVMAAGYGVQSVTPAVAAAAEALSKPAGGTSDDLATAALAAVDAMARASGHPLTTASSSTAQASRSSSSPTVFIVVAVVAVATAAAVLWQRRRAAPRSGRRAVRR